jgi:hypothetical protein
VTENQTATDNTDNNAQWSSTKVYTLSVICLVLGVVLGALFHGPAAPPAAAPTVAGMEQPTGGSMSMPPAGTPNPHMMGAPGAAGAPVAPKDPVFDQLKSDPNNVDLLVKAGNADMKAGDPKAAEEYYGHALNVKDNPDVRVNLANAYFRAGDGDRSLDELGKVLKQDPKNDKALYNTGFVRLMAKNDPKGAIAAWRTLLKYYPNHPHKADVEQMIKKVQAIMNAKGTPKG